MNSSVVKAALILCALLVLVLVTPSHPQNQSSSGGGVVILGKGQSIPERDDDSRVLVLLHGLFGTSADMERLANEEYQTGDFDRVIVPTYDSTNSTVGQVAPALFDQLNNASPNAMFDLVGFSKGGMVARDIAEHVPDADGRVEAVVTLSTPNNGADPAGLLSFAKALGITNASTLPGFEELLPGSDTYKALNGTPQNDMSGTTLVETAGQTDWAVTRNSALYIPNAGYGQEDRAVLMSILSPGSTGHLSMRSFLANRASLFARLLDNDIPSEAQSQVIEMADELVKSKSEIPSGWVPCVCPGDHPDIGVVYNGTRYHSPDIHCPN